MKSHRSWEDLLMLPERLTIHKRPQDYLSFITPSQLDKLLRDGMLSAFEAVKENRDGNDWVVYRALIREDYVTARHTLLVIRRHMNELYPGATWQGERDALLYTLAQPFDDDLNQFDSVGTCAIYARVDAKTQLWLEDNSAMLTSLSRDIRMSRFWLTLLRDVRRNDLDWWLPWLDEESYSFEDGIIFPPEDEWIGKVRARLQRAGAQRRFVRAAYLLLLEKDYEWEELYVAVANMLGGNKDNYDNTKRTINRFKELVKEVRGFEVEDPDQLREVAFAVLIRDIVGQVDLSEAESSRDLSQIVKDLVEKGS